MSTKLAFKYNHQLRIFEAYRVFPKLMYVASSNGRLVRRWVNRWDCMGIYESKREARQDFESGAA